MNRKGRPIESEGNEATSTNPKAGYAKGSGGAPRVGNHTSSQHPRLGDRQDFRHKSLTPNHEQGDFYNKE